MSTVVPSKESLEREWLDFKTRPVPLSTQDKLQRTTSLGVLTHVRMPDGQAVKPTDMSADYGFTYEQWVLMRSSLETLPVKPETEYCCLGGVALTLEAFEAGHNNIQLGQE